MIQKIKTRFILLSMWALLVLLVTIITGMNFINYQTVTADADYTLQLIAKNKGQFPEPEMDRNVKMTFVLSPEAPYESRYFSVLLDENKEALHIDTSKIKAIDEKSAVQYASLALQDGRRTAFLENYRFLRHSETNTTRIIFLDCGRNIDAYYSFLKSSIVMGVIGYVGFFFVVLFFSNKILRPVTESYEKQRRFITDAGHELKTPLAIIKANADVLEMEQGENGWLEGIQEQVRRLTDLTADLVYLSRMDEADNALPMIDFPFSDVVSETAVAFQALALTQNKSFRCSIPPMLSLNGNEKSIRQLVNILMDNALKYSPEGGIVSLTVVKRNRQIQMTVFNSTESVIEKENLDHLFDRFYRVDSSRNSTTGGYGIGLSVAQAIVAAHNGKISASTTDGKSLEIFVLFPM